MEKRSYKGYAIAVLGLIYTAIAVFLIGNSNNATTEEKTEKESVVDEPASDDLGEQILVSESETAQFSYDIDTDILTRHALPSFDRMEENDSKELVETLDIYSSLSEYDLGDDTLLYPEKCLQKLDGTFQDSAMEFVTFGGNLSSELQNLIDKVDNAVIEIESREVVFDSAITLKSNVYIKGNGVVFSNLQINVSDSTNILLENIDFFDTSGTVIALSDSSNIKISGCRFENVNTAIALDKYSNNVIISQCDLKNCVYGIVASDSYLCYISENSISQNEYQGVSLHSGTVGFFVEKNLIQQSASSEGILLDNSAYNIIQNNIIKDNYKGGIRFGNSVIRTLVMENIIENNNPEGDKGTDFTGIIVNNCLDQDRIPDYENIICRNIISGNHVYGIYIGIQCYVNDVFDNVIMESLEESVHTDSDKYNSILNNISNN